ncbi:hypothetical protein BREVUG8_110945 [Brevundimonas sp. G8]|nr:hypothetical protein BREVUG8_110945 [Brevundimonas sp. G8]
MEQSLRMPSAPCATTPVLATAGSPAVTGTEGRSPSVEGNGGAVDFRGAVTRSEGVVWGQVVVALRDDDTPRRRRADTDEETSPFVSVDAGAPAACAIADPTRAAGIRMTCSSVETRRACPRSLASFA